MNWKSWFFVKRTTCKIPQNDGYFSSSQCHWRLRFKGLNPSDLLRKSFSPWQREHGSIPLVRGNKRGFGWRIYFFPSVVCPCKRDSGRRTNRRSDVSYSDNLLPLSYAQRSHKFKGRAVWTDNPDSSSKEQRARHLRMTDIFPHPSINAIGAFGSKG